MKKARKDSWKTISMPENIDEFMLNRAVSRQEFELLKYGEIPEAMEDKWFIYYDSDKLYFHRSWTGFCIFIAEINSNNSDYIIGRTIVNRNSAQYKETSIEADKNLINLLLSGLLGQSNKETFERWKQLHGV